MSGELLSEETEILLKQLRTALFSDRPNCAEFDISITNYSIDIIVHVDESEVINIVDQFEGF